VTIKSGDITIIGEGGTTPEPAGEVLKVAGAEGAMEYAGTWAGNWWNLEENMNLDITAYDYLWIDYDGFEGAIQFGIFYSEWQKTESWGEVWYTDQVDLTDAAGIVGIPVEKTKIIEKGVGGVDSEFKGDVYAKHARQVFTQDKGKASKINIKGIYLGTKEQYEAALAGASAINAVKAAESQELLDFCSRKLYEITAYTIMCHLILADASKDAALFGKSAKVYVNFVTAEIEKHASFVENLNPEDVANYRQVEPAEEA
jgi:hypothetical protein